MRTTRDNCWDDIQGDKSLVEGVGAVGKINFYYKLCKYVTNLHNIMQYIRF